ncbi:hypothetical protein PIB30_043332 [Stylosanthes scabra]|uniref:RING-type domain-containing protein n=1 Tax=Stylosanthes scabra TaxID=79078 RepID=A0ABU6TF87_9FABA|nr:hypothetical protein [Stylosanthes scabra]
MSSNHGRGHHPRSIWSKLCFSNPSWDSDDDDDFELDTIFYVYCPAPSVEIHQPPPPPEPEPQPEYDLEFLSQLLPPPPPPPPLMPSSVVHGRRMDIEPVRSIGLIDIFSEQQRDQLSNCPICTDEFEMGEIVCMLPCNHAFHFSCINRWLETSLTCPVCRQELGNNVSPCDIWRDYFSRHGEEFEAFSRAASDENSEEDEQYDSANDEIDDDFIMERIRILL